MEPRSRVPRGSSGRRKDRLPEGRASVGGARRDPNVTASYTLCGRDAARRQEPKTDRGLEAPPPIRGRYLPGCLLALQLGSPYSRIVV